MEEIRDCIGHLACCGDAKTGYITSLYKGHRTSTYLSVGETFVVERSDSKTEITRISDSEFRVASRRKAA